MFFWLYISSWRKAELWIILIHKFVCYPSSAICRVTARNFTIYITLYYFREPSGPFLNIFVLYKLIRFWLWDEKLSSFREHIFIQKYKQCWLQHYHLFQNSKNQDKNFIKNKIYPTNISALDQRCFNVVDQRSNNVENETKSDVGFSTSHNANTMHEPDFETASKQRCTMLLEQQRDSVVLS